MTSRSSVRLGLALAAGMGCSTTAVWAQTILQSNGGDKPPANGSLGGLARQTRPQAAANDSKSSRAQQLADEMQQEQEAADNAPVGFKNYDAGAYRLFVPYPYSLEGREEPRSEEHTSELQSRSDLVCRLL